MHLLQMKLRDPGQCCGRSVPLQSTATPVTNRNLVCLRSREDGRNVDVSGESAECVIQSSCRKQTAEQAVADCKE